MDSEPKHYQLSYSGPGMSTSGTHVRNLAVPGLMVVDLCEWLASLPPSPHIQHVTFHISINSCREGSVSVPSWSRPAQVSLPPGGATGLLHPPSLWPAPCDRGGIKIYHLSEAGVLDGECSIHRPHPDLPHIGQ